MVTGLGGLTEAPGSGEVGTLKAIFLSQVWDGLEITEGMLNDFIGPQCKFGLSLALLYG